MKLYRIKDWNERFENNRSRDLKSLSFVLVPNRHDGENYTAMITQADGAKIFAAWILMLQVASKCEPRGTLVRGDGKPHTSVSLSIKTRAPVEWFSLAFVYLEANTDWLISEHLDDSPVQDVQIPHPSAPPGPPPVSLGERKKGTEGKEENRRELVARGGDDWKPTWEQAQKWLAAWRAHGADYEETETRSAFLALEAGGWMWGRNPVADPRAALERQIQTDRNRNQRGLPLTESGKPTMNGADTVKFNNSLDRVRERIKAIKSQYEGMQTWSQEDREELKVLRIEEKELKQLLGVKV